jgi:hypothetical protein
MIPFRRGLRNAGAAAILSFCLAPAGRAGVLYVSGFDTIVPGQTTIKALDTASGTVTASWAAINAAELPFAVGSTVRTFSRDSGFGAGSEYTLNGTPSGISYPPLSPGFGFVLLTDGTRDATHNYAVDGIAGNVYSFDRSWGGASLLFTLPSPAGALWTGISYDATNNSLWAADFLNSVIADFALDGTPLSSFATSALFPSGLALDPSNHTLWTANGLGPGLDQYATNGTHLNTLNSAGIDSLGISGMEFAPVATPEPAVFGLAGFGLAALIVLKIRASSRAGSR